MSNGQTQDPYRTTCFSRQRCLSDCRARAAPEIILRDSVVVAPVADSDLDTGRAIRRNKDNLTDRKL